MRHDLGVTRTELPVFEYYLANVPMTERAQDEPRTEWRWRLIARNGEIVASGEGYPSKAHVKRAIATVRRNVATAGVRSA